VEARNLAILGSNLHVATMNLKSSYAIFPIVIVALTKMTSSSKDHDKKKDHNKKKAMINGPTNKRRVRMTYRRLGM